MQQIYRIIRFLTIGCSFLLLGILIAWKNPFFLADSKIFLKQYIKNRAVDVKLWDKGFELIKVKSSIDGEKQKCFLYKSKSNNNQPLVVSLHSWGGNYREYDSLALLCQELDINYLHPDFRGANSNSKACLSKVALGDIDDAIDYVLKDVEIDTNRIFVIGKSGGGLAALGVYLKSRHKINTVSSWVPITNLIDWYDEGEIKRERYVDDILRCTSSENGILNLERAKERSPIFWSTDIAKKRDTKLLIYAGIYDGINGAVSISHSINFYNKTARVLGAVDTLNLISKYEKNLLLANRSAIGEFGKIGNRDIIVKKNFKNLNLILFDGGHEILAEYALNELLEQ